MSRSGRKRHRRVRRAIQEHEAVFGPLRSRSPGDVITLNPEGIEVSSHFTVSAGGTPLPGPTLAIDFSYLKDPAVSLLQKFSPMKLRHVLNFLKGEHYYLLPSSIAVGEPIMIFGVEITAAELALLKEWAKEEGLPNAVKEYILSGKLHPEWGAWFASKPQ